MTTDIGRTGIWSGMLRYGDQAQAADAAAELEGLGYSALWVPDVGGDLWTPLANLMKATTTATIATGILNVWMHEPEETAAKHAELTAAHGDRFLCGIGISHQPFIDLVNEPGTYKKPLAKTAEYLDGLDAAPAPLAPERRVLAALGPKMLELAASNADGAHPYWTTPEHTETARSILGPDKLLCVEQKIVLSEDPEVARETAIGALAVYIGLPNYRNNWLRLGFTEEEISSHDPRFLDAVVAWGDEASIRDRLQQHLDAGADHVCIQALPTEQRSQLDQLRELAPSLLAL